MKNVVLELNSEGIEEAIDILYEFARGIESKDKKIDGFLEEVGNLGVEKAQERFSRAIYDGTNDVSVEKEKGDKFVTIRAEGESVLFIEYGTGVTFSDEHPEKVDGIVPRGSWGDKHGSNPKGWVYRGEQGSFGMPVHDRHFEIKEGLYRTLGNPSNMCMYLTKQDIENKIMEIARRHFDD